MQIRKNIAVEVLPICFLIQVFNAISWDSTFIVNFRWVWIISVFYYLMLRQLLINRLDPLFFFIIYSYFGWCFLSSFWSDILLLSLSKSILFALVATSGISLGLQWMRKFPLSDALNYLAPVAIISLLSGFWGFLTGTVIQLQPELFLFQGFISGSNMLGILLCIAFPYLLWKTYLNWTSFENRSFWLFFSFFCFFFLTLALSRSALLSTLATFLGFLFSLKASKKFWSLFCALLVLLTIFFINPLTIDHVIKKYVYKTTQENSALFYTREQNWADSYQAAKEGGWSGLGFGVSVGWKKFNWNNALTSVGYGREKGNSQLAIIEETGIIGFLLYLLLLSIIILKLILLHRRPMHRDERVFLGIVEGMFAAIVLHSIFEGWWTSPGALETFYFWVLTGIIRGLELRPRDNALEIHGTKESTGTNIAFRSA